MFTPSAPSASFPRAPSGCASSRPARPSAAAGASADRSPVGSRKLLVKSVDQKTRHETLLERGRNKYAAVKLLENHDSKLSARIHACGFISRTLIVELLANPNGQNSGLSGIASCNSTYCCPRCAPKISARRKAELDTLLSGARADGLSPVMMTFTASHSRQTALAPFLDALKRAKQRFHQRKEWRALPIVGHVTATETTFGANGHHPHYHQIALFQCSAADAVAMLERLRAVWITCLEAFGLSGSDAAFHVQPAAAVGQYIGKFAAASEMALSGSKRGRKGSRNPWQLLADARSGDPGAAAAWVEFALAFKGRRQLVWSRALKARYGIDEKSDADVSADVTPDEAAQFVAVRAWLGNSDAWRAARKRSASLLVAAAFGGNLDAAEFGPTDAQLWQRLGGESLLEPPE